MFRWNHSLLQFYLINNYVTFDVFFQWRYFVNLIQLTKKPSGSITCTKKEPRFYWSCSSVERDATPLTPPSAWALFFPNVNNTQSMIPEELKNITSQWTKNLRRWHICWFCLDYDIREYDNHGLMDIAYSDIPKRPSACTRKVPKRQDADGYTGQPCLQALRWIQRCLYQSCQWTPVKSKI